MGNKPSQDLFRDKFHVSCCPYYLAFSIGLHLCGTRISFEWYKAVLSRD